MSHPEFRHRDRPDDLEQVLYREAGAQAMPPPAVARAIQAAAADAVRPSWPVRLSRWLGLGHSGSWPLAAGSLAALVLAVSLGVQVWERSPAPVAPAAAPAAQVPAEAASKAPVAVPEAAAPAAPAAASERPVPAPAVQEAARNQKARAVSSPPPPPPPPPAPAVAPAAAPAPAASGSAAPPPGTAGLLASLRPGLSRDQVQSLLRQADAQPEVPLRTRSPLADREAGVPAGESWRLPDGQRLRCRFLAGTGGSEGQGERLEGCSLEP